MSTKWSSAHKLRKIIELFQLVENSKVQQVKGIKSKQIEEVAAAAMEEEINNMQATFTAEQYQIIKYQVFNDLETLHTILKFYTYRICPIQQ